MFVCSLAWQKRTAPIGDMEGRTYRRVFLLSLKKKYAGMCLLCACMIIMGYYNYSDGQKIAKKLCRQISKETAALKSLLKKYNIVCASSKVSDTITMAEIFAPAAIEERLRGLGSRYSTIATGKKRQIIDAYLGLCRSKEELEMLKNEAKNIIYYYEERKKCIIAKLTDLSVNGDLYSRGSSAMLRQLFTHNDILLKQGHVLSDAMTNNFSTTEPFESDSDDSDFSDDCDDSDFVL